jgi:hypothetical protein
LNVHARPETADEPDAATSTGMPPSEIIACMADTDDTPTSRDTSTGDDRDDVHTTPDESA